MDKDTTILMLAERLYICSRLLTCAAERLGWNSVVVQGYMKQLEIATRGDVDACINENTATKDCV